MGDFDHFQPKNATVFHHEGEVRIKPCHLPGAIWLNKTEQGEAGYSEPLDQALLGFHGKTVRATVIIEEIDGDG